MTTLTTIDHAGLIVIAEQHAHRDGYYQTLTETAAKHLIAQHAEDEGESRPRTFKSLPDCYAFNGIYSRNYEAKVNRGDAQRNGKKRSERYQYRIGNEQYLIYPRGIVTASAAYAMGKCPIEVDDNGEIVMVGEVAWNEHVDLYAERYLCWLAWKSHELHDRAMTAQAKRKAMNGGGARFPDKLADAIQNTLSVYGPLRFADIWKLCDELRMHAAFGGKRHKAQKALDDALDQGRIKGFGVVPNVTPTVYTVEMNS